MKQLITLLIATTLSAQSTEILKVEYTRVMTPNIEKYLEDNRNRENSYNEYNYKQAVLKEYSKTSVFYLEVNDQLSNFYQEHRIDNEQPTEPGDIEFHLGTETRKLIQRNDVSKQTLTTERFIGNKSYLVENSLPEVAWTINKDTLTICGNKTQKAIYINKDLNAEITAYFSTTIKTKHGPLNYWGLPGLILEINIKYLQENPDVLSINYKCNKIETIKKSDFSKLRKGKNISQKEFDETLNQYLLNFREMHSDGVDKD